MHSFLGISFDNAPRAPFKTLILDLPDYNSTGTRMPPLQKHVRHVTVLGQQQEQADRFTQESINRNACAIGMFEQT